MSNLFFPEIEKESLEQISRYQDIRLREALAYLEASSPYYRGLFHKEGIDVRRIATTADLVHIPVTTKRDLQQRNDDFLCVPKKRIVDYITTSGTLGDPVTFAMTDLDLERLAYNEAISFACAGGAPGDVFQLMTTMDRRFMAGL
ncbi:MAG: phenylacetate--CoA ligase family protein, partial [Bacteroidota bacterium]